MNTVSRRQFLKSAAVPDRTLKLGLIGCGWCGMVDVEAAFKVGGVDSAHPAN